MVDAVSATVPPPLVTRQLTVADTASTTDASGRARTSYTAGPRPGAASIVATASQLWTTTFTIYIEVSGS